MIQSGKPLFPGADHIDQLTRIMNVVGTPNDTLFNKIQSDDARNYIKNLPKMQGKDFAQFFGNASADAVDLLKKMLNLDPDLRFVYIVTFINLNCRQNPNLTSSGHQPKKYSSIRTCQCTTTRRMNLFVRRLSTNTMMSTSPLKNGRVSLCGKFDFFFRGNLGRNLRFPLGE